MTESKFIDTTDMAERLFTVLKQLDEASEVLGGIYDELHSDRSYQEQVNSFDDTCDTLADASDDLIDMHNRIVKAREQLLTVQQLN